MNRYTIVQFADEGHVFETIEAASKENAIALFFASKSDVELEYIDHVYIFEGPAESFSKQMSEERARRLLAKKDLNAIKSAAYEVYKADVSAENFKEYCKTLSKLILKNIQ